MRKKEQESGINYLDLIPEKSEKLKWHNDYYGKVVLEIPNEGFFHRIAQEVFNKPKTRKIHLDQMGTYIWPLIDGQKTVADIAVLVKEEFGEKAEPLYSRLVKYFQIMESNDYITFQNIHTGV